VMVTIVEVDIPRKRIALSLKENGPAKTESAKPQSKIQKPLISKEEEVNAFQSKLMELKKQFK